MNVVFLVLSEHLEVSFDICQDPMEAPNTCHQLDLLDFGSYSLQKKRRYHVVLLTYRLQKDVGQLDKLSTVSRDLGLEFLKFVGV
jgi:hypothetical protein